MSETEDEEEETEILAWGSPQPDLTRHFGRVPIYRVNGNS